MRLLPGIIVIFTALSLNAQNVSNSVAEFVLTQRGFLRGQTDGQVDTFFGIPYSGLPRRGRPSSSACYALGPSVSGSLMPHDAIHSIAWSRQHQHRNL